MAESTLNLTLTELKVAVGDYLSFTRTAANWDSAATAKIEAAIASGLRQFYFTPLMPGQSVPHEWSFLKPEYRLALVANDNEYELPDNFAHIEDPITIESDSVYQHVVKLTSQERINVFRQGAVTAGYPAFVALKLVTGNGASTPRYRLMVWPDPDQAYTLIFRYTMIPDLIVTAEPIPLCGAMHAETLMAACVAAAERMYLDGETIKQAEYQRLLMASIARDQKMSAPALISTRRRMLGVSDYESRGTGPVRIQGFDY